MTTPRIEYLQEKQFVGLHITMSLMNNQTIALWRNFMPRRKEIQHPVSSDLYSLQVYPKSYFSSFSPHTEFEKWALVEVSDTVNVPQDMSVFILSEGKYAVFDYKGSSQEAPSFFQYIFMEWLPNSGYELDHRPHFEVLGEKYKNNDPDSEEEIWIPIV